MEIVDLSLVRARLAAKASLAKAATLSPEGRLIEALALMDTVERIVGPQKRNP